MNITYSALTEKKICSKMKNPKCFQKKQGFYEYSNPRLENMVFRFPDEEPDTTRMLITHIDMDPTEVCNLRCSYCFKGKLTGKHMSLETAKQAVRFLVRNSGNVKDIGVSLMGGEPMLAFSLLKKWVPWAHRYCEQRGKAFRVTATTNGTVFDDERHDFCRAWRIGLHLSIDGLPEVQDRERVYPDGSGSSKKLEENMPRIFNAWRVIHARSTIVPETLPRLSDSYQYFCEKGFLKVAFSLAGSEGWGDPKILEMLKIQFRKVLEYHWNHMKKNNRYFVVTLLDNYVEEKDKTGPIHYPCGAARGSVHVDTEGILWPCHRFAGVNPHKNLLLGSVWGGFNNNLRDCFLQIDPNKDYRQPCGQCEAKHFCKGGCIAAHWQENLDIFEPGKEYCKAMLVLYQVCKEHEEKQCKNDPKQWYTYLNWVKNYIW